VETSINELTKLFLDLYLAKLLDTSAKSFFLYTREFKEYLLVTVESIFSMSRKYLLR